MASYPSPLPFNQILLVTPCPCFLRFLSRSLTLILSAFLTSSASAAADAHLQIGIAVRDITPNLPIRLSGYAGRNRPADRIDHPLVVQALALKNPSGERCVLIALDSCEVSRAFMKPVLQQLADQFQLAPGAAAVVSSHTHSAPVLEETLIEMAQPSPEERQHIAAYSHMLRSKLVEVTGAALDNCQPALLHYGLSRATFAMNRRLYRDDQVVFGDNPDGPVDWDVPVLRVTGTNGAVRALVFGYACHGTSIRTGDDWYVVCGEYMAYARQHLEAHHPGATALFLTGMGADSDPSPRGTLLDAKKHGLELAGAVIGALHRPLRPVRGPFRLAFAELQLPLVTPPSPEQLDQDARSDDPHVRRRADVHLAKLNAGLPLPDSVTLPLAVLRLGDDLTFVLMGGEVVVDYSRRIKRLLAADHPWTVGYAYDVPCYIPSARLIKEGGYETESSMIYYGFYGPFRGTIEALLLNQLSALADATR